MLPKTPYEVQRRVGEMKSITDNVAAHAAEDNLYRSILQTISNGEGEDYQNMCRQALKSQNLSFSRGYHEKTS